MLLVAVSLRVMTMMMLLIPVTMFYPVLAVSDICADCCSKMFTSASMDQLNVFVFSCVCVPLCSVPKKNYVYVVRLDRDRVNAPTAPGPVNAGVSHVDPLNSCHWLCLFFSIVFPSDVSVSDWLMSNCCPFPASCRSSLHPNVCVWFDYVLLSAHP